MATNFLKGIAGAAARAAGKAIDKASEMATNMPQYQIEGRQWDCKKQLGEGGFGTVYYAVEQSTGREAAIKRCVVPSERLHEAKREIESMKVCLKHENCVQLLGSQIQRLQGDATELLIVTEFCKGGNLHDAIQEGKVSGEREIMKIFSQVLNAVRHLHSRNPPISHRDLKLANVYLNHNTGKWALGDFGSCLAGSKLIENKRDASTMQDDVDRLTTPQFRAPEQCNVLTGTTIDTKVDVWALGVMLFAMAYKKLPWDSTLGTLGGRYRLPETPRYSEEFVKLFAMIFVLKPDQRPSSDDIAEYVAQHWESGVMPKPREPAPAAEPLRRSQEASQRSERSTPPQPVAAVQPQPQAPTQDLLGLSPPRQHGRSLSDSAAFTAAAQATTTPQKPVAAVASKPTSQPAAPAPSVWDQLAKPTLPIQHQHQHQRSASGQMPSTPMEDLLGGPQQPQAQQRMQQQPQQGINWGAAVGQTAQRMSGMSMGGGYAPNYDALADPQPGGRGRGMQQGMMQAQPGMMMMQPGMQQYPQQGQAGQVYPAGWQQPQQQQQQPRYY